MSDKLPPSIFPARFQILSGSMLKLLALYCHADRSYRCNHTQHYPPALTELFYINGKGITSIVLSAISDDVLFLFSVS